MSNVFDHLHIKQHTAGSSNELSFDVLDAARSTSTESSRRRRKDSSSINPSRVNSGSLGSYHGTTGTSTLSRQAEVTRRKRERRARSIRLWAVAFVVVIAMMVSAVYVGYQQYSRMQDFQMRFDGVVQRFVAADQDLPAMEEFMSDPISSSRDQRSRLKDDMTRADLVLNNIIEDKDRVSAYAITSRDKTAIEQVVVAAEARLDMIDAATKTLDIAENSASEASEVNSIWNDVIDADQKARQASSAANNAKTQEETEAARKQTQEVEDLMKSALTQLESIDPTTESMDLSPHIAYLQKRIESLDHALATSDALIAGDRDKAAQENDAYNYNDKEAVELAKLLPQSVNKTVEESFQEQVEPLKEQYAAARDQAIEADSLIRQYIGS